jgi:hypothetical protein
MQGLRLEIIRKATQGLRLKMKLKIRVIKNERLLTALLNKHPPQLEPPLSKAENAFAPWPGA